MEVDASRRLQNAVEFGHALRHHGEVGHHVVLSEEAAHRLQEIAQLFGAVGYDVLECYLGLHAPAPCVLEGSDLCGGVLAGALAEQDVVRRIGVERRVEVDEVNALVSDVLAEDVEVVAEVELVSPVVCGHSRVLASRYKFGLIYFWAECRDSAGGLLGGSGPCNMPAFPLQIPVFPSSGGFFFSFGLNR